jgi:hypothetical protein
MLSSEGRRLLTGFSWTHGGLEILKIYQFDEKNEFFQKIKFYFMVIKSLDPDQH